MQGVLRERTARANNEYSTIISWLEVNEEAARAIAAGRIRVELTELCKIGTLKQQTRQQRQPTSNRVRAREPQQNAAVAERRKKVRTTGPVAGTGPPPLPLMPDHHTVPPLVPEVINLVNEPETSNRKELLLGLFKVLCEQLKLKDGLKAIPIRSNIQNKVR